MHRFNMGNDNPVRNNKLLREAYQAGLRQALNEVSGGDAGGGGDPFGGGGRTPAFDSNVPPIADVDAYGWIEAARAGQNVPNWVIAWFAQNASWLSEALKQAMAMGGRSVNMGGLREQAMPPTMQSALMNYNTSATKYPGGGNRMGMGTNMGGKGTISAEGGWTTTWPWGNDPYPPNGWQGPDGWQWQRRPGSKGNSGWQRRRFDPFPPPGQWTEWQPPSGTGWSPTSWPKYQ